MAKLVEMKIDDDLNANGHNFPVLLSRIAFPFL